MAVTLLASEVAQSGQGITVIIFGLVGVAFLLALLTAWYWQRTKPLPPVSERRRYQQAREAQQAAASQSANGPISINQQPQTVPQPTSLPGGGQEPGSEALSVDEWMSLTGRNDRGQRQAQEPWEGE